MLPEGTALSSETVQVLDPPAEIVPDAQPTEDSPGVEITAKPKVFTTELSVALMVALTLETGVPAVAVKVALLEPDVTVTVPGTVTYGLLLESETAAPPAEAAPVSAIVHVLVPAGPMLAGAQARLDRLAPADG